MSKSTGHTPGPWQIAGNSIITKNDQLCIAVIEDDGGYEAPEEQRDANARLIAAAPDLFEFMELMAEMKSCGQGAEVDCRRFNEIARLAIAKAKGL